VPGRGRRAARPGRRRRPSRRRPRSPATRGSLRASTMRTGPAAATTCGQMECESGVPRAAAHGSSRPTQLLTNCRSASTSDTSATGARSSRAASAVSRSIAGSAAESRSCAARSTASRAGSWTAARVESWTGRTLGTGMVPRRALEDEGGPRTRDGMHAGRCTAPPRGRATRRLRGNPPDRSCDDRQPSGVTSSCVRLGSRVHPHGSTIERGAQGGATPGSPSRCWHPSRAGRATRLSASERPAPGSASSRTSRAPDRRRSLPHQPLATRATHRTPASAGGSRRDAERRRLPRSPPLDLCPPR
jgi:hypothetical protein